MGHKTCWSCVHFRRDDSALIGWCEKNRPEFPIPCKEFAYEPGSDEEDREVSDDLS